MAYGYQVPNIDEVDSTSGADVANKMMANLAMMIIPTFLKQSWADARESRRDETKIVRDGAEKATVLALNSNDSEYLNNELRAVEQQMTELDPGSYEWKELDNHRKRFVTQIGIVEDAERKDEML